MTPALGTLAGVPFIETAKAQTPTELPWRHALSLFGDVKYPADFKRFDYVNPDAPKGGTVRQYRDRHLRQFQHRCFGREGQYSPAPVELIYETLTTPSLDEVSTRIRPARRSGRPS